jgi:hypothetical protein
MTPELRPSRQPWHDKVMKVLERRSTNPNAPPFQNRFCLRIVVIGHSYNKNITKSDGVKGKPMPGTISGQKLRKNACFGYIQNHSRSVDLVGFRSIQGWRRKGQFFHVTAMGVFR